MKMIYLEDIIRFEERIFKIAFDENLWLEKKMNGHLLLRVSAVFYDSLCNHDAYYQVPPHPENMLILQGDADPVVNPRDTMDYARKFGIKIVLFEGTDHVYKRPGEKERIISETGKFLLRKRVK